MINTNNIPSNYANVVSPYSTLGSKPVGQENPESKNTPLKPVEELAKTARTDVRREQLDVNNLEEQRSIVQERSNQKQDQGGSESQFQENRKQTVEAQNKAQARIDEQQKTIDQQVVAELSARDREVRVHEQAHKSAGGQLAGSATYEYERGPDGKSYAVEGEVPINLVDAGDPEKTKALAEQVQRAALAPAEPSTQDRRVAAQASQMRQEAVQDIAQLSRQEAEQARAESDSARDERLRADEVRREQESQRADSNEQSAQQVTARQSDAVTKSYDINQKLIDIGVTSDAPDVGGLVNQLA
jgi:hypothetical protein